MDERDALPPEERTICHDCGIEAWWFEEDGVFVSEEFHVSDELWDATCPDDRVVRWVSDDGTHFGQGRFVVCIGCFERRLGRQLTLRDFLGEEKYAETREAELHRIAEEGPVTSGPPPSRRFLDRWRSLPPS
jgi:hypothetical protein